MRPGHLTAVVLLFACCLCVTACKHTKVEPNAIETMHNGSLAVENGAEIANSFYVDVQGQTRGMDGIVAATEAKLRLGGYEITNNPSEAGHILHLNILHSGACNANDLRIAVAAGYGNSLHLGSGSGSGDDATGLVADALLVQRRIPTHKRPSFVRLKNISNRNAVGNSQMRFGLLLPSGTQNLPPAFVEVLSRELATALQSPTQAPRPRQGDGQGQAR